MKVIKSINNNIAICLDNNQRELVAFGKGIGYPKTPYELTDLSFIESTYYGVDTRYYDMLTQIPEKTLSFVQKMIEKIQIQTGYSFGSNIVFILADHIDFAVKRCRTHTYVPLPYSYDIEYEYPKMLNAAKWIIQNVEKKYRVHFQDGEVSVIAMHLIECLNYQKNNEIIKSNKTIDQIIEDMTQIIENYFTIQIKRSGYNYFRFKNHVKYLMKRLENHEEYHDDNSIMLSKMRREFPNIDLCVAQIDQYINKRIGNKCNNDELLYLFIHVNRLYVREGCNQPGKTSED